ncbi:MAG: cation transporter [Methylococcales bacterium]|nr:cation transporter [Methylococcales bacterium]
MPQIQQFNQFTIAHQLNRQLQIIIPSLHGDKERATVLKILLLKRQAIESVEIAPEINSVTIHFDPEQISKQNLLNLLDCVLANFPQKPPEITKGTVKSVQCEAKKQEVIFRIKGMSCTSCALFLEMLLSREADIHHVSIDYISGKATVSGHLSKAETFKIIENNGYQAY